jgi:DNA-binding response OmpR family regulator
MAEIDNPTAFRPTILVIEEDNGARPYLTRNLRLFGFRLLVAANLEDAIEWLGGDTHIHADLLLLDLIGKQPEESLAMGRRLRCKAGYPCEVPVVVMPEKVAKDVEGTDEKAGANDWICHYEDSDQLHRLLVRLLQ